MTTMPDEDEIQEIEISIESEEPVAVEAPAADDNN